MLKPYDGYKQTTYDWLEKVPSHWEQIALRNITELSDKRNEERTDLELLSVYREYGVIKKSSRDDNHNVESLDLSNYKYVDKGYLVINKMKLWQGSLGVSKYEGIVSPAYIVCRTLGDFNLDYLQFLLRSPFFKTYYNRISKGIRVGQWDSNYEDLKNLYIFLPTREEQDQIVKYLDWQTSKINTFIKTKKKQIELLKEQKQAVINQAVTKGLDDTVPMKDSGIEWLGKVPEHWEVNRLKRFCKVNASIANLAKAYEDNDKLVFLPMENITVDGKIDCSIKRPFREIKSGYSSFAKHDVVIAKITPCFENGKGACLDELETEIGYGTTELITIRAYNNILPKYLYLITMTQHFRLNGEEQMTGSAGQKRVPTDFVANFIQGIPHLDEQQAIVTYLEEKTALIDKAIAVIEKEIELVSEYKTSLISSVVIGKLDVRDVVIPDFEVVEEVSENTENDEDEMEE